MSKVYNQKNYYTKYNIINFFNKKFYLIKWQPKMKTIIHNHPYVNCTFYLLNGKLKENIYKIIN